MSARLRRLLLLAAAVAAQAAAAVAFLRLPWADGRAVFAGRGFTGPELARLARNLDLFLPQSAGPAATLAALALYCVPVAAVGGALLVLLSAWTDRPAAALRAAAAAGVVVALAGGGVILALAAGPAAGDYLGRVPGAGAVVALGAGVLAAVAAGAASASARTG